jgi:serine/threonine protein phosphatase PrpC
MISAAGATNIGGVHNLENQDHFFVGERTFGVFDGHGANGDRMARTAMGVCQTNTHLPFPAMFALAEDALKSIRGNGGTTASILQVAEDGSCTVGHVGDSEVILATDTGTTVLSEDHSALNLSEYRRIQTESIDPAEFIFAGRPASRPVFVDVDGSLELNPAGGNYYCNIRGDWASYLRSDLTGEHLAVSRALGDHDMKWHGVSAQPSVLSAPPPAEGETHAIVMASDGLWDAMRYEDVRAIVRRPDLLGNASAAVAVLMQEALNAGQTHFHGNSDNVCCVVVYVKKGETTTAE